MKSGKTLTYDSKHNIADLRLRDDGGEIYSVRVGDDVIVDLAEDGSIYGIEFLNPNSQLLRLT